MAVVVSKAVLAKLRQNHSTIKRRRRRHLRDFRGKNGVTLVMMRDLCPSKKALDTVIASGSTGGCREQFDQRDALPAAPGAYVG
ncbi:MAG: hypothetical protein K1X51_03085 [Rhodospirillaceae bacterium]|nr:hypothetical protein [Rhodospirillaceae bacterium]